MAMSASGENSFATLSDAIARMHSDYPFRRRDDQYHGDDVIENRGRIQSQYRQPPARLPPLRNISGQSVMLTAQPAEGAAGVGRMTSMCRKEQEQKLRQKIERARSCALARRSRLF